MLEKHHDGAVHFFVECGAASHLIVESRGIEALRTREDLAYGFGKGGEEAEVVRPGARGFPVARGSRPGASKRGPGGFWRLVASDGVGD